MTGNNTSNNPNTDNIAEDLYMFNKNIREALDKLTTAELSKLRSDLNDPNKKINDILVDLAADNKYDGDGTQTVDKLTEQQVAHIKSILKKLS